MRRFRLLVVLSCALGAFALPSAARADDLALNWPDVLPGLTDTYDPNSANECTSGKIKCVDSVIKEMTKRFKPQATSCDHNALFSLLYLRVTETYRDEVGAPGDFFSDEGFVNHEDAVFASYLFNAEDDYANGHRDRVPLAWRIALDAARDKAVSGEGNLLLGVNAHVNRDLPYVLAAIGLVKPDGSSRKPDHDLVNEILYDAYAPAIAEGAQRFDPSVNTTLPVALANALSYQTGMGAIQGWRESAWRFAERLESAPDASARAEVAQEIENFAATQAQAIKAATAYGPLQSSASRDAFCATHHG
jgi:Family of unknown function (DUF5995)